MRIFDDYSMTVGGKAVTTEHTRGVVNPANGQAFAAMPLAGADHLDAAVAAAAAAFPKWKALRLGERRERLLQFAAAIETQAGELGALLTREQGRPTVMAAPEIAGSAKWLAAIASQDLPVEVLEDSPARRVEIHHEPLGVVAAIVPWNFPIMLAMWKIAPALLTGNTMVLKPSPFTPLCSLKLGELSRDSLPPGVFNVICGDDSLGPLMSQHPGFAKISFTGSTATGKRVMAAASRDLKRITLELGGNDAAVVLPDVDVEKVANALFFAAFRNTAQVCIAPKRLYVHEAIYERFRDTLHRIAQNTMVGDGSEPGVQLGPLQNEPQFHRVQDLIDDARRNGLRLLQGREVPKKGYFVPVTLVDNPPEDSRVVREEAFGPVLPLMKYRDIEEVIARVNSSEYGLASSVWSDDLDKAASIAQRIEAGSVAINHSLQNAPHIPFAGAKQSGFGVEHGKLGLMEYTYPKAIYLPKKAPA
jgi:acyl-CoA reductase-like NAD-dependent aldehyde dehydrogenase